jgi:hypothetical protein
MPHQYAVLRNSPAEEWYALDAAIKDSSESFRAYFRGYRSPNLYWIGPDGWRYWRTRFELNRCHPDSVEPLRRVDKGAGPILDWDGPPWAPNGIGLYERGADRRWWPRFDGTRLSPCRACLAQISELAPRSLPAEVAIDEWIGVPAEGVWLAELV